MNSPHRPPAVTGSTVPSRLRTEKGTAVVPRAASVREEAALTGSPVSSSSRSSSVDNREMVPRAEVVTGSPVSSPSRSLSVDNRAMVPRAEVVTGSPVRVPRASSIRDEAATISPVSLSHREYEKANSFSSVSSFWSPLREAENPIASPLYKDTVTGSPMIVPMTLASIIRSPLTNIAAEDPSLEKSTSPMVPVVNRLVSRETTPDVRGRGGRGSMWVESGTSRQLAMRKAAIGLRILALVLSMISFSVMAADKTYGWDGDSFDRYREFRYCLSVNVLVFVYSLFQGFVQIHHRMMKKHIMSRPVSYSFDFFMDQILAYLLMSASSSVASRNGDWVLDFGRDHFTKRIDASIAMSFLAFFALAFSSIISAYKFFSWT